MYYLIITLTIVSFILGILGLIMIEYPIILVIHRVLSIGLVFILAIHIYKDYIKIVGV